MLGGALAGAALAGPVQIFLLALVAIAAAYDLRYRRVPNWLTVSGVCAGVIANTALDHWQGLAAALVGLLCALAVYLPLYLVRGMGAGDVKLMAAVGALAGPRDWLAIFFITALAGGVVSLALIAWKKRFRRTALNLAVIGVELLHMRAPAAADAELDVRDARSVRLPHAAVIATGCILFLLFGSVLFNS